MPYLTRTFHEFIHSQKFGGFLLIGCTIFSLLMANTSLSAQYLQLFSEEHSVSIGVIRHSISFAHFINEGLMAVFFLLVGMEIRRELKTGELSSFQKASLPAAAALGGMIFPALIYSFLNHNSGTGSGWGIPMATDIAFAIAVLALLGKKIPDALKILLIAIAVADDLGAVAVIAFFYTHSLARIYLVAAAGVFLLLKLLNIVKIKGLPAYLFIGIILWYCVYKSGVHSTISGVLLAFAIPFDKNEERSPLIRLEHLLQRPVNYFIMPLFALANTAIVLSGNSGSLFSETLSIGILSGLIIGKPVGIFLFSWLAVRFNFSKLPTEVTWKQITGIGFLGGIGFTMSVFISLLAFQNPTFIMNAKISILVASTIAGCIGFILLRFSGK